MPRVIEVVTEYSQEEQNEMKMPGMTEKTFLVTNQGQLEHETWRPPIAHPLQSVPVFTLYSGHLPF